MKNLFVKMLVVTPIAVGALWGGWLVAQDAQDAPPFVTQTNLVSDIPGLAQITDPKLINPWGVSHSSTSPFWTSNQGTNTATLYTVTNKTTAAKVNINPPAGFVQIPTTAAGPQGPTGQVNNTNQSATGCDVSGGTAFPVKNGGDGGFAHFIFANLNGTISAWDTGVTAYVQVTAASGTVYTGLAVNGAQTRLYAANDTAPGSIDVYDCTFNPVAVSASAFVDPSLPSGLVPFNVEDINGFLYVAYAPAGRPAQQSASLGAGAIAVFDEAGNFVQQLVAGDRLAAPWGIALAPPGFGQFAYNLLVGNFSYRHSEINAYNPITGKRTGRIPIYTGGIRPGGLWAIGFGVGGSNGDPGTLYFADGINSEMDGLFGAITATAGTTPSQ
jgi:uncharacterized protein (TIGR03118 family)